MAIIDDQVTLTRLCGFFAGRFNFKICFCARYALEILQALFDVAQIKDVAGLKRQGVCRRRGVRYKTDGANTSGDKRQGEFSLAQVLRRHQHACGDKALRGNRVLHAAEYEVDALGTQAAAQRRVVAFQHRQQCKLKPRRRLALQLNQ